MTNQHTHIKTIGRAPFSSLALLLCLLCGLSEAGYAATGNCGTPSFNSPPLFNAGITPNDVAAGDLNGDGVPDLAVPNFLSDTLSVLFADGDGAFLPPQSFPVGLKGVTVGTSPRSVAIGDMNGDGKADIVVGGGYSSGWVAVLLGDGMGHFASPQTRQFSSNAPAYALALGDFNGDGKRDVAAAGGQSQTVNFLFGDGAGGFTSNYYSVSIGADASALAAGDFNSDALTDVVVTKTSGGLSWGLAIINGGSNLVVNRSISMRDAPGGVAVADFNLDGKLDIAVTFTTPETGVEIFYGDGADGFGSQLKMLTPYDTRAVATGDFNQDGFTDLAVSITSANSVAIYLGLGNDTFSIPHYFGMRVGAVASMAVADFNKDGHSDIVATYYNGSAVTLLAGDGTGAFAASKVDEERSGSMALADFNGDGKMDVAVPSYYEDEVHLRFGDGTGGFSYSTHFAAGRTPTSVVTGDFNHDGKADLVVSHDIFVGYISVLLGDGTGKFAAPFNVNLNAAVGLMATGDFDNDGNPDLALLLINTSDGSKVALLRGNGAGGFLAPVYVTVSAAVRMVILDVNGDGKLDLALTGAFPSGQIIVLLGDGAGGLTQASNFSVPHLEPITNLRAADINNDGRSDLIVMQNYLNKLVVLLNNGAGFDAVRTIELVGSQGVAVADFNADGNPDLAVTFGFSPLITYSAPGGNVAVLSGDGAGNFNAPAYFTAGGDSAEIAVADFNGDARPDLVTPNYIAVLLNTFKAQPCLSISDTSVTEGYAGTFNAVFNVTLSAPSNQPVKVNYSTQDHTATGGADYLPVSGRLVFAPGVTTQTIFVPIVADTIDEFDEDFYLLLSNSANADIGRGQAVCTIADDDPEPGLSISDWSEQEGSGGFKSAVFNVTLSAQSTKSIKVAYSVADGTAIAGKDFYGPTTGTLLFNPGETTKNIYVTILEDFTFEPDETFFVNLSNPENATLTKGQGAGKLINDDTQPVVSVMQNIVVNESDPNAANYYFVIGLSNPSYQPITVNYATADGTATAGSDYVATSGSLLFNPDETEKRVTVPVINDSLIEPTEIFYLNLTGAVNASIGSIGGQGQGIIIDDDTPLINFNSSRYNVSEGAGFATVTVLRSVGTTTPASVEYATSDGTATQRTKYTTSTGTLNFASGETSKTFTIPITDEAYAEGNQTVILTLRNPTGGAVIGVNKTAVLTIIDNDTGTPSTNPIDDSQVFVRQHYNDFLSRVPDVDGLGYWTAQLNFCGADPSCLNERRIGVSAAFFVELEFQETGSVVYRFYKAAYGVRPTYNQFMPDRSQLIGGPQLQASTLDFANRFVQRDTFKLIYPDSMSTTDFVNRLFDTAGLTPFTSERQQEIQAMSAGRSRAEVLLDVINTRAFKDREYNPSFVLMQYFGYLRRDPEEGGYQFWLDVLNNKVPGNYRGMVCSFITSREYQERFSSVSTRSNQDCANIH